MRKQDIEYLKIINNYLKDNRKELGKIDLSIDIENLYDEERTMYGILDNKLIISDQNSIYLLNYKNMAKHRFVRKIIKNAVNIDNAKTWYNDIVKITSNYDCDALSTGGLLGNTLLSKEQLEFYKYFFDKGMLEQYSILDNTLITKSPNAECYIYTKKKLM